MKSERVQQLIVEIQDLTRQYHAEVSSVRKPWPKSIKNRIQELFTLDVPVKRTVRRIDIPYATIMSWRIPPKKKTKSNFHALAVRPGPTVTVTTPEGYILELPESIAAKIILELQRGVSCF